MSYTVGLLSPGDMGSAVGKALIDGEARVLTCLEGRSDRTRTLASEAGIVDVGSYANLVEQCELVISIMVPAQALGVAEAFAEAIEASGKEIAYTDCNAIAPQTARKIGDAIREAGGVPIDAGIIGPPPRQPGNTRFYASGESPEAFDRLNDHGLDVRVIGKEIGQASGLKMCYAALTKGTSALSLELLIAAKRLGLYDQLIDEFELSQEARLKAMNGLTGVPSKSRRWIGEMEEIAKTFEDVGMTPNILLGAADMFRMVGDSNLADETPENRDRDRTLADLIEQLAN